MMKKILKAGVAGTLALCITAGAAHAEQKTEFSLAWSIYVGWMPWGYAADAGIVDKWADKYGISIDVERLDYVPSIEQFSSGAYDAVTATNMDILGIAGFLGLDTTALIIGDYSNGNDVILTRDGASLESIQGAEINMVELSVSEYLMDRAIEINGLEDSVTVNTSDADMAAVWYAGGTDTVVTWNPIVAELIASGTASNVFDSSMVPGEILDMTNVNSAVLADNPDFGKALVGAWYETMALMAANNLEALEYMAVESGTDLDGYNLQLNSTEMFYDGTGAVDIMNSAELKVTMQRVHDWLNSTYPADLLSPEPVGIEYADGSTSGAADNIMLRFDPSYMQMFIDGKL